MTQKVETTQWKPTACILCECNCGVEVKLGGENGRRLLKFRGDRKHPSSEGYACEKPHRLDYYQNGCDRLTKPLRRKVDGSFEEIEWDVAITEVAERLARVRDTHGGDTIFYYGGGGQGNHLPGVYAAATRRALGSRYRSSALAQEKTGEFWVSHRMLGAQIRGDFEHCEVAIFLGKNPWYSHSIPKARVTLKKIAKDPDRKMIVIDPRVSKTAELADVHLRVKPGTDAWLLSALLAVLVQEKLLDTHFLEQNTVGIDSVLNRLAHVPISDYCAHSGVPEAQVREAAQIIGKAASVASFEDLGVQMNRHSTLVSYLHRLVWLLTGNFGKQGSQYIPTPLVPVADGTCKRESPVAGARIIGGLVPCNVIADEILTDHPKRYRAMIVEATNPAHSLAGSKRFAEALRSLDTVVVIDVAMTETARLADYILPASTQFEKAEATFFNFEFPKNYFHLRQPILPPLKGPLPEAEIHARLVEALGLLDAEMISRLQIAAKSGMQAYTGEFMKSVMSHPKNAGLASVILYRTLGPVLPPGLAQGAVLWGLMMQFAMKEPLALARAGFTGPPPVAAGKLFEAVLKQPSGVIFAVGDWDEVLGKVGTPEGKIQLELPDMLEEWANLVPVAPDKDYPFILSAGERRAYTANTIFRDAQWRQKGANGALAVSPSDAESMNIVSGDSIRLTTRGGSAVVEVMVTDAMLPGHISLPNGTGLENRDRQNHHSLGGVAPNLLTETGARDPFAGTPWHKNVPAKLEAIAT